MESAKKIVIAVLIAIPVLFGLFLLAAANVLYMLLALIVLLCFLLLLRRQRPEWFRRRPKPEPLQPSTTSFSIPGEDKKRVYMVLDGRTDFGARRIMVNKANYYIGRSDDNDFSLEGSKISRHHLQITYSRREQICYAMDKDSANGTYLNSVRMVPGRPYKLNQGDHLMIDGRDFEVEYARY